jgi:predicted PurR-regulated permease PerM
MTTDRLDRIKRYTYLTWFIIGLAVIVVACGYVLGQVWTSISIVLFSAFLVFVMRVPVAFLERRGIPRTLGTVIAYLATFLIIVALITVFALVIWEQILSIIALIPGYMRNTQAYWQGVYEQYGYLLQDSNVQQVVGEVANELSRWATNFTSQQAANALALGTNAGNALMVVAVSMIVGFWVLIDLPRIGREIRVLVGPSREADALFISHTFAESLGGYLKGVVINGACTGAISFIFYSLVGLPHPGVFALLSAMMNFIPFVGPWIAGITAAVFGLFISPLTALLALLSAIVPQSITDNLISPRVMSSAVQLHPAATLVMLFAGASLGGILGMICAIPVTAAAKTIFVYYFEKRSGRDLDSDNGAFFRKKPPAAPRKRSKFSLPGKTDKVGDSDKAGE